MYPIPTHRHRLTRSCFVVALTFVMATAAAAAAPDCRPGEVARCERISEVCSCRGWTITAECRSRCCTRSTMLAGIHTMCGEVCDRPSIDAGSSDLVRETDDGASVLVAAHTPRTWPRVRFGVSTLVLPDAADLVSGLFPEAVEVLFPDGPFLVSGAFEVGEADFDADSLVAAGIGLTIDITPRWSAEVGLSRSTDAVAEAAVFRDGFFRGRIRSDIELTAVRALARLGHNDPAVPCPWSLGLGVQRWRVEPSRVMLTVDDEILDGPLLGLVDDRPVELDERQNIDELIAAVAWQKRWSRLTAEVGAVYGSRSSVAAHVALTFAMGR